MTYDKLKPEKRLAILIWLMLLFVILHLSLSVFAVPINIPLKQWIALETPDPGKGVTYGYSPTSSMKHVAAAHNPINGRIYFEGGDYFNPGVGSQSYQQTTYSLSIADRFSNLSNRNAGWRLEYPACGPAGNIQPKHPDTVGWAWDSKRNVFWMVPGVMEFYGPGNTDCPGESNAFGSDPGFIYNHFMTFNPATQQWTDRSSNIGNRAYQSWAAEYDSVNDTIIRFGSDDFGNPVVGVYDIVKDKWTNYPLNLNAAGNPIFIYTESSAIDLDKRLVYAIDGNSGRLHSFHLDSHNISDLGPVPGGTNPAASGFTHIAWDSINKVLMWPKIGSGPLNIYHPDTKTWEANIPTTTNIPGLNAKGRLAVFDPYQNVLIFYGGIGDGVPVDPYFYIYRYADGTGAPPPPDTTPPAISNVLASGITSNSATITWNTNEMSTHQVEYGLTASYGSQTIENLNLMTSHSETLSGLSTNTLYHFRVRSKDASGNLAVSTDFTFTTASSSLPPDTTPPVISNVIVYNITQNSANVTWNTDEMATHQVEYGLTNSYGSSTTLNQNLMIYHSEKITGLVSNTTYHYKVKSRDASGNLAMSNDFNLTTLSPLPLADSDNDGVTDDKDFCPSTSSNVNVSKDGCPIPPSIKFSPNLTTNFSNVDLRNFTGFKIGVPDLGQIDFGANQINLLKQDSSGAFIPLDLANLIDFPPNKVVVRSDLFRNINVSSTITLFNVTNITNPSIFRENSQCAECRIDSFSGNAITFTVPHYTEYSVKEGSYCGDSFCSSQESCSSCSSDCGSCPSSSSGSSGGGSSGSGGSSSNWQRETFYVCSQDWECGEWSACVDGEQTRKCNLAKVPQHAQDTPCPSLSTRPITTRKCETVDLSVSGQSGEQQQPKSQKVLSKQGGTRSFITRESSQLLSFAYILIFILGFVIIVLAVSAIILFKKK